MLASQSPLGVYDHYQKISDNISAKILAKKNHNAHKAVFIPGAEWRKEVIITTCLPIWNNNSILVDNQYDIYEFGVYTGTSLVGIVSGLKEIGLESKVQHIWGFDSFEGLPKDTEGNNIDWSDGFYDASFALGVKNPEDAVQKILTHLEKDTHTNTSKMIFIIGFFSDSLTSSIVSTRGMNRALFVDIDSDQYIGTVQALDWLFKNNLIVPTVTVIAYDDWCQGIKWKGLAEGEPRAHREIAEKFLVKFKQIHNRPSFLVESIGTVADPGVTDITCSWCGGC